MIAMVVISVFVQVYGLLFLATVRDKVDIKGKTSQHRHELLKQSSWVVTPCFPRVTKLSYHFTTLSFNIPGLLLLRVVAEAVRGTAEAEETSAAGPHGGPVRLEVCPLNSNKQVAHHIRIIVKF
jgi:hypothetical protein